MLRNVPQDARHVCWLPRKNIQDEWPLLVLGCYVLGPEIIAYSIGMTLLLRIVTVPPLTGNFNIPCAVDGTARIFLIPVLPIIPLCWDGDLITMKFIHAEVECSSSPIFTSRDIWPIGQMVSPLNPMSDVIDGII
ncbi:hypothetical protein Tco_0378898 [Tanacetum coccineum]